MPPAALMTGGSAGTMGAIDVAIVCVLILDCNPYYEKRKADFLLKYVPHSASSSPRPPALPPHTPGSRAKSSPAALDEEHTCMDEAADRVLLVRSQTTCRRFQS